MAMEEIDFATFYSEVHAFGFIEDRHYYRNRTDLNQFMQNEPTISPDIAKACLHESMTFLSTSLANLLSSNHEKSGGYSTWSRITEYYSYYYAQVGLLRLAGGGSSTAYLREEDKFLPIWFWRVSNDQPRYQTGQWSDLRRFLGISGHNPIGGIHGKVSQFYTQVFSHWESSPPHFPGEIDSTLRILRQHPPFPYEYPIELRIEYNYMPRHLISELSGIYEPSDVMRSAELGPQDWEADPEEWWFSLTVWDMIKYGFKGLYLAGHQRSIEWMLEYIRSHEVKQALKEEVINYLETIGE